MALPLELPDAFSRHVRTARQVAKQHRKRLEEEQLPTACDAFDRLLEGGLRRGTMVELIGQRSSGRFSLVLSALAAATERGEAAALIDLGDAFDPQLAQHASVDLERLLWTRPRHLKEVLASAEIILSSGIPLVILDLGMPPLAGGRGQEASWLRLARRALAHRAALLIASPYRVSGTAAQAVVQVRPQVRRWMGRGTAQRLLGGVSASFELLKSRTQRPGAPQQGDRQDTTWRSADLLDDTPVELLDAPPVELLDAPPLAPPLEAAEGTIEGTPARPFRPRLVSPQEARRAIA